MKKSVVRKVASTVGLALLGGLVAVPAYAADPSLPGGKQASTIVSAFPPIASTDYTLTKRGSIQVKSSVKPGDGGVTMKLSVSGVDCPGVGNNGGAVGKCGVDPAGDVDHVMVISSNALGIKFNDIVGIRYRLLKGKPLFQDTGTNKMNGAAFGALVTVIFGTPLGIGNVDLKAPGSVPSDCDTVPLPTKTCKGGTNAGDGCTVNGDCNSAVCTNNGCADGDPYGIAGVIAGTDPGVTCAVATDCADTQLCTANACVQEPCATDLQCDQNGLGGTGQCGSDGFCCDPNIDPTCAGQV